MMNHTKAFKSPGWLLLLLATMLCVASLPVLAADDEPGQVTSGLAMDSSRKADGLYAFGSAPKSETSWSGYEVKQVFEFGGRVTSYTGNPYSWQTFVNLDSGPRLMEYSLNMHSPKHAGLFFDDLSVSNFGYGGDPNNMSRLAMSKGHIYSFKSNFKRDVNFWDYNLLANPLNPTTSVPYVPMLTSPHAFETVRKMYNTNLDVFTSGPVRLRFGWSRVTNDGSSYTSTHQGTEGLVYQPTRNTNDTYSGGITLRVIPRTAISYDQYYSYFKGDTFGFLNSTPYQLAGPIPVDLGIPFNTPAGQPCATPILGTGFVNPACNGYLSYNRSGNSRTKTPTEQASFQSNYFRRIDLDGRFTYTSSDSNTPAFVESFTGLTTRTRARQFLTTGSSHGNTVMANAAGGATIRFTDKFRASYHFQWENYRMPGGWNLVTDTLFGATLTSTPNVFSPATCPPPFTAATCPQHASASSADHVVDAWDSFLKQATTTNTLELQYDFTHRFSAYIGYRYQRRSIYGWDSELQTQTFYPGPTAALANRGACVGVPLNSDGTCTAVVSSPADPESIRIDSHGLMAGFTARPIDQLRINFDTEFMYADGFYTRIDPRHLQRYKVKAIYKPVPWMSFGSSFNILENRNDTAGIGNKQHNRQYAVNGTIAPGEGKYGFDFSYQYTDVFSGTNICLVATPAPAGATAINCGTPFLNAVSFYKDKGNYASASVFLKPVKRVTTTFGYTINSENAAEFVTDPWYPGPSRFNYTLPSASVAIQFHKNFTARGGWNYYDFNDKGISGSMYPRSFRGNVATISLRYEM